MGFLVSFGISAGIIAGILAQYAGAVNVVSWIVFASTASFFAAGGKKDGFIKSIASNLSGVIYAMLVFLVLGVWQFKFAMGTMVFIIAFMMVVQARFKVLSFISGAFIGCAATFGTGGDWKATVIALLVGAILGFIMEQFAALIFKTFNKNDAPKEA